MTPLEERKFGRITEKSELLKALEENRPYHELRKLMGRESWLRPWLLDPESAEVKK